MAEEGYPAILVPLDGRSKRLRGETLETTMENAYNHGLRYAKKCGYPTSVPATAKVFLAYYEEREGSDSDAA